MDKTTFKDTIGNSDKPLSQWIEVGDIVSRGLNLPTYKVVWKTNKDALFPSVVLNDIKTGRAVVIYDKNSDSKEYYLVSGGKKQEWFAKTFVDGDVNPFLINTSSPVESGSKLNINGSNTKSQDVQAIGNNSKDWNTWKKDTGSWEDCEKATKQTTASPNTDTFSKIITDPHYKIVNDGGDYPSLDTFVKTQCVAKVDIVEFIIVPVDPKDLVGKLGIYEVEEFLPKSGSFVSANWISEISQAFNERNWKLKYVYKVNPFFIMVKPGDLIVKGKDGYINILTQKEFDAIYIAI